MKKVEDLDEWNLMKRSNQQSGLSLQAVDRMWLNYSFLLCQLVTHGWRFGGEIFSQQHVMFEYTSEKLIGCERVEQDLKLKKITFAD